MKHLMSRDMKAVAWHDGVVAAANNFQRVVPEQYQAYAEAWKAGYDGKPLEHALSS